MADVYVERNTKMLSLDDVTNRLLNISKAYHTDFVFVLDIYDRFEKKNYKILSYHDRINSECIHAHELECVRKTSRYLRMYEKNIPKYKRLKT